MSALGAVGTLRASADGAAAVFDAGSLLHRFVAFAPWRIVCIISCWHLFWSLLIVLVDHSKVREWAGCTAHVASGTSRSEHPAWRLEGLFHVDGAMARWLEGDGAEIVGGSLARSGVGTTHSLEAVLELLGNR